MVFTCLESDHVISLGYDPVEKKWVLFDANQLPSKIYDNDEKLALDIISALKLHQKTNEYPLDQPLLQFDSYIFCKGKEVKDATLASKRWIVDQEVSDFNYYLNTKKPNVGFESVFSALKAKASNPEEQYLFMYISLYDELEKLSKEISECEKIPTADQSLLAKSKAQLEDAKAIFEKINNFIELNVELSRRGGDIRSILHLAKSPSRGLVNHSVFASKSNEKEISNESGLIKKLLNKIGW